MCPKQMQICCHSCDSSSLKVPRISDSQYQNKTILESMSWFLQIQLLAHKNLYYLYKKAIHMGNSIQHPLTEISFNQLSTKSGVIITSASMQGWRQYMEDFCSFHCLPNELVLAGVFDGHGGPEVACYVSRIFHEQLQKDPFFQLKNYNRGLVNTFKRVDEMIISQEGEQQLRTIQKQFNSDVSKNKLCLGEEVGATANILLLTPDKIYVANIGDSRSVLCRSGKAIPLSEDHKPQRYLEKDRITKAGGHVHQGRINSSINVSRTFGDFYFKSNRKKSPTEQMVISVPQIKQIEREKGDDQYIVMATDGVWQKYGSNSQELIDQLNACLATGQNWKQAIKQFLYTLVPQTMTENKTGYDNMTLVLVLLDVSRFSNTSSSSNLEPSASS